MGLLSLDSEKTQIVSTGQKAENTIADVELNRLREFFQIPVTYDYPEIDAELCKIKENLIDSFLREDFSYLPAADQERVREYQKILSESNLRIVLADSNIVNACHFVEDGIIVVNRGLIRESFEQGLGADAVAFVIGHEISHLLYEKSEILGKKDKCSTAGQHDKEYQCDKDGVILMDIAGYNPYVATVFKVDESTGKYDLGLLSSHPEQGDRNARMRDIIEGSLWNNYSEDKVIELARRCEDELLCEDKVSIRARVLGGIVDSVFIAKLKEELKFAIDNPILKSGIEPNDEVEIDKVYENYFLEFERELKEKNPSYSKFAKEIFQIVLHGSFSDRAVHIGVCSKTADACSKRLKFLSPKTLLLDMKTTLPANAEMESGRVYDSAYQEIISGIYSAYSKRIAELLLESKDILSDDMVALGKEGFCKMGPSFLKLHVLDNEGFRNQLGDYLERIQSRDLVLYFSRIKYYDNQLSGLAKHAFPHHVTEILRKNKWCSEVLDASLQSRIDHNQYVDLSFVPYEKKVEILRSPNTQKDMKAEIIASDIIPRIKNKEIQPLDLIMVFNSIKDFSIPIEFEERKNRENEAANIGLDLQLDETNKVFREYQQRYKVMNLDLIDAINEYVKDESEDVKQYWKEQLSLIGVFQEKFESIDEVILSLSKVPSDAPNLDRSLKIGKKKEMSSKTIVDTAHLVNVAQGAIEAYDTTFAELRGYKDNREKFIVSDASKFSFSEEEAFVLARCFTKIGFDSLEERGFFLNLDNVSRYWKEASPHQVWRIIPGFWVDERSALRFGYLGDLVSPIALCANGEFDCSPSELDLTKIERYDVSHNFLTEPVGPTIKFRDFVFLRYLKQTNFDDLTLEKKEDAISWVKENLPRKCNFRDMVLSKIWELNGFDEELTDKGNKDFFMKYLSLYDETSFRREFFSNKIYKAFRDDGLPLEDKLSFLIECFPHASASRDSIIDDMVECHLANATTTHLLDLYPVFNRYSRCDRHSERNESVLDGTLGSLIHNLKVEEKAVMARWLFLDGEKPEFISRAEITTAHIELDFLRDLMVLDEERHKAVEMLFFGKNGIAMNEACFNSFIDDAFSMYFPSELESSKGKFQSFGLELVKKTLNGVSTYKREKLLNRLFDLSQNDSANDIETFLPEWVAGYSPSAVKLLQIVGSRPEVEKTYPRLHEMCEKAKSSAERMSYADMVSSLATSEELRNGDYVISDVIGSASIKVVLRGRSRRGEDVVIKVLRHNAGKFVSEEAEELNSIVDSLKPTLKELWQVESMPRIADRASLAALAETNFKQEVENSAILAETLKRLFAGNKNFEVVTPETKYHNKNLIVESLGQGQTMDKYLEGHPEDAEELAKHTQEIFLRLLGENIVLADLHQGNILVENQNGKFKFTLIDTGSLYKLDDREANIYKKAIVGMVLSVIEQSEGYEALLNGIGGQGLKGDLIRNYAQKKLSSDKVLRSCVKDLVGDETYNLNKKTIDERLSSIKQSNSALTKPLLFLELLDDLKDAKGNSYFVSDSIYWSLIGLTKPYGLTSYQSSNLSLYKDVFGSVIRDYLKQH